MLKVVNCLIFNRFYAKKCNGFRLSPGKPWGSEFNWLRYAVDSLLLSEKYLRLKAFRFHHQKLLGKLIQFPVRTERKMDHQGVAYVRAIRGYSHCWEKTKIKAQIAWKQSIDERTWEYLEELNESSWRIKTLMRLRISMRWRIVLRLSSG